jgi:hypothetical protein
LLDRLASSDPVLVWLQIVLIGVSAVAAILAPVLARISHTRQHIRLTRRSMILATLAHACPAVGVICLAIVIGSHDRLVALTLATVEFASIFGLIGLRALAFKGSQREVAAPQSTDSNDATS